MKGSIRDFLSIVIAAALVAVIAPACTGETNDEGATGVLEQTSRAFSRIARDATPAVVFINVEKTVEVASGDGQAFNDPFGFFGDDLLRRFFRQFGTPERPREPYTQRGAGTGFLISDDGYILSNNHVVGDADKITVTTQDGTEYEAERVGTDPKSEVAVIRIEGDDFPYLPLGDSSNLEVGEWVVAIGNPFGLTATLTVGVVSAKGRSNVGITDYEDFIQTDAAINPGNSGGPLLNIDGEVVGINTAIYSRSGGYMGIGFAIPVDMAAYVKDQLIEKGEVTRSYLGVYVQPVTKDLAESFGLDDTDGILVSEVVAGSGAEKGGLEPGDVILELNGEPVESAGHFRNEVAKNAPGTKIELKIARGGDTRDIEVKTGAFPEEGEQLAASEEVYDKLGMTVQNLTPDLARRFGYVSDEGVIVSRVEYGGSAATAGIQPGDLIRAVNQQSTDSVDEFKQALSAGSAEHQVLMLVKNARGSRYVVVNVR